MKQDKIHFRKRLKNYYAKRFKNLDENLRAYLKMPAPEPLHKLRVEIKKLNTLIHLLQYCRRQPYKPEQIKTLQKVFKLSGRLRSVGIDEEVRKQFWPADKHHPESTLKAEASRNELLAKYKKYAAGLNRIKKIFDKDSAQVNYHKVHAYLNGETDLVNLFTANPNTRHLHDMRKAIKDIIYIHKMQGKQNLSLAKQQRLMLLMELENAIGEWHDMDKFIGKAGTNTAVREEVKIPVALKKESTKRLRLVEEKLSAYAGKSIMVR